MVTLLSHATHHIASDIEELAPGTTCEWLCERQIYVMTASDSSRASVDAWVNRCIEIANAWPANRPIYAVIDSSSPNIDRTPYMRARLKEMRTLRTDLKWYIAMIAPKTYLMQLMMFALRLPQGNRETRLFFDREEAVRWLQSKLPPKPQIVQAGE